MLAAVSLATGGVLGTGLEVAGAPRSVAPAVAATAEQPTPAAIAASVVDLRPEVTDLRLEVDSTDGSESRSRTPDRVTVTLAADVLFEFAKATLTPAAETRLADLAVQLHEATGAVAVDGYTDAIGSDSVNGPLSQQRADAVRDALRAKLPGTTVQFTSTGHGKADPVAPEKNPDGTDNPSGRARNRRVTVSFRPT